MEGVIIGLIVLAAILLILLVLAQNAKGGIGGQFGGGGVSQAMGVKKGADLLEKLTWGFAAFIMAGSILVNVMFSGNEIEVEDNINENFEAAKSQPLQQAAPAPAAAPTSEETEEEVIFDDAE